MLYIYSQPNNTYFPVQNCFHLFNQFEGGTTWCWLLTRQSTFSSMWQRQVLQLNAGWYIKEMLAYYKENVNILIRIQSSVKHLPQWFFHLSRQDPRLFSLQGNNMLMVFIMMTKVMMMIKAPDSSLLKATMLAIIMHA